MTSQTTVRRTDVQVACDGVRLTWASPVSTVSVGATDAMQQIRSIDGVVRKTVTGTRIHANASARPVLEGARVFIGGVMDGIRVPRIKYAA